MADRPAASRPAAPPRLSLGPVLFNWPGERRRDFYFRIADEAPVDVVYLGEIVCSKRTPFQKPFLPEIAERLARAGKEVVWSTPILIETRREIAELRELAADGDLAIEANDLGAVALLSGRRHCIGPALNVYNEDALAVLAGRGATRFALPWELPAASIAPLAAAAARADAEIEVNVFGRMPLAISARCYHARANGLAKDSCRYVCADDPDGLEVRTLDHQPFLAVNGVQTLSHRYLCLLEELPALVRQGAALLRLWPHDMDMVAAAGLFRAAADGRMEAGEARAALSALAPAATFANGFYHGAAGAEAIAAST
ncbi:MAG: U32 family peptidase [Alphaproteobacteria bacterium]|nr:U32 family peptidase [Alphaproteobacteria bacterium]